MSPTPQRKGSGGAAKARQIQERPAAPAAPRLDPSNRDGEFLPNPQPAKKTGRAAPETYDLRVIGPHTVGGVAPGGRVSMELTEGQLTALLYGGHVEAWTEDPEPEDQPPAQEPEPVTSEVER
jgi:hypothetical protein